MRPNIVQSVEGIENAYVKRILSNVVGKDPMKVLERTPRRLRKLVKDMKKKHVRYHPAPGKWSIAQIVNHLADTELVLAFRLRMVLAQSGSPLQAMDQDKWAGGLGYETADVDEQLELFTAVRHKHLSMWKSLTDADWDKFGLHEERGRETVERIAQLYAGHDINHLQQIEAIRIELRR
jgi:hypothetical protein